MVKLGYESMILYMVFLLPRAWHFHPGDSNTVHSLSLTEAIQEFYFSTLPN